MSKCWRPSTGRSSGARNGNAHLICSTPPDMDGVLSFLSISKYLCKFRSRAAPSRRNSRTKEVGPFSICATMNLRFLIRRAGQRWRATRVTYEVLRGSGAMSATLFCVYAKSRRHTASLPWENRIRKTPGVWGAGPHTIKSFHQSQRQPGHGVLAWKCCLQSLAHRCYGQSGP